MTKLNSVVFRKLAAQAEEAKEKGLNDLSEHISSAIGEECQDQSVESYAYQQLQKDVHNELWKIASHIMSYYDVESADAEAVHQVVTEVSNNIVEQLKVALRVDDMTIGPREPKVPGEEK